MSDRASTPAGDRRVLLGLIGTDLILSALAVSRILVVIADPDATSGDRILAWVSFGALPVLLVALVALLLRGTRFTHPL